MSADGYASKAGDPRRSGRAHPASAARLVVFIARGRETLAKCGRVVVGTIMLNPADRVGRGYVWRCYLPDSVSFGPSTFQPAADEAKARDALRARVEQWFGAIGRETLLAALGPSGVRR